MSSSILELFTRLKENYEEEIPGGAINMIFSDKPRLYESSIIKIKTVLNNLFWLFLEHPEQFAELIYLDSFAEAIYLHYAYRKYISHFDIGIRLELIRQYRYSSVIFGEKCRKGDRKNSSMELEKDYYKSAVTISKYDGEANSRTCDSDDEPDTTIAFQLAFTDVATGKNISVSSAGYEFLADSRLFPIYDRHRSEMVKKMSGSDNCDGITATVTTNIDSSRTIVFYCYGREIARYVTLGIIFIHVYNMRIEITAEENAIECPIDSINSINPDTIVELKDIIRTKEEEERKIIAEERARIKAQEENEQMAKMRRMQEYEASRRAAEAKDRERKVISGKIWSGGISPPISDYYSCLCEGPPTSNFMTKQPLIDHTTRFFFTNIGKLHENYSKSLAAASSVLIEEYHELIIFCNHNYASITRGWGRKDKSGFDESIALKPFSICTAFFQKYSSSNEEIIRKIAQYKLILDNLEFPTFSEYLNHLKINLIDNEEAKTFLTNLNSEIKTLDNNVRLVKDSVAFLKKTEDKKSYLNKIQDQDMKNTITEMLALIN